MKMCSFSKKFPLQMTRLTVRRAGGAAGNKRAKASKKKPRNGLSECAEEFRKELNISKEEYQRRVCERLCLKCGRKGHYVGDCKGNSSSASGKGRQD